MTFPLSLRTINIPLRFCFLIVSALASLAPCLLGQGLLSLGGAWTSNGRSTSITQDSNGRLLFTNEMGWKSSGSFANATTVVATDWEGGLRGSLQNNGNTIRWANGTAWFRVR
jgi:hypothetical protein